MAQTEDKTFNYGNYTQRAQITKCLHLGLKPVGNTAEIIKKTHIHEFDDAIYEQIQKLYPPIDSFVLDLASKVLTGFEFPFNEYSEAIDSLDDLRKADKNEKSNKEIKKKIKEEIKETKNLVNSYEKSLKKSIADAMSDAFPEGCKGKSIASKMLSADFMKTVMPDYIKTTKDTSFDKIEALTVCESLSQAATSVLSNFRSRSSALETLIPEREAENFLIYKGNIAKIKKLLDNEDIPEIHDFLKENEEFRSFVYPESFELVMSQKGIQAYNEMIGGLASEEGIISKGINIITNEMNTKNRKDKGYKGAFFSLLKPLKKMPLAADKKQFNVKYIKTDDEVKAALNEIMPLAARQRTEVLSLLHKHAEDGIYIQGKYLHQLSHLISGDHDTLPGIYIDAYINSIKQSFAGKKITQKAQRQIDNASDAVRDLYYKLSDLSLTAGVDILSKIYGRLMELHLAISASEDIADVKVIKGNKKAEIAICRYYEVLKEFKDIANILFCEEDIPDIDSGFHSAINDLVRQLTTSVKSQNPIRNYITRKVSDIARPRPSYLGYMARMDNGWWNSGHKFQKKFFTILQKDGKYYLFCLTNDAKPFDPVPPADGEDFYLMRSQKKIAQGFNSDFALSLFSRAPGNLKKYFAKNPDASSCILTEGFKTPLVVTKEEYDLYMSRRYTRKANDIDAMRKFIALAKRFATSVEQYSGYDYSSLKEPEEYDSWDDFCDDVDKCSLILEDIPVSATQIESLNMKGYALIFLIYERTMYDDRVRKKNEYASAFIYGMSEENRKNIDFQFNSYYTVLYRPAVLDPSKTPIHKKGSWLLNKRDSTGMPIPGDIYTELYNYKNNRTVRELSSDAQKYIDSGLAVFKKADRDITKDLRYTKENYSLAISYTMNRKAPKKSGQGVAPDLINRRIKDDDNGIILSITRSQKHLLYYSIVDTNTDTVLENRSLNVIDGYDYMEKIRQVSNQRSEEKALWQNETTVKDLKDGYCRRAISEIIKAAFKFNVTSILCESLSDDFKDRYSCIDNQMFKGFEKKLTSRLACIRIEGKDVREPGGIVNPIQLADDSGNTYQDGILYFVPNAYIASTDPENGFCPVFNKKNIKTTVKKRAFFSNMKKIFINDQEVKISFDFSDFDVKADIGKTEWTVVMQGACDVYDREHKCYKRVDNIAEAILCTIPEKNIHIIPEENGYRDISKYMYDLPAKTVDTLWKYFNIVVYGNKIISDDELYTSPITNNTFIKPFKNSKLQIEKHLVSN